MRLDPLLETYPLRIRQVSIGVILWISVIFYIFPRALDEAAKTDFIIKEEIETFDIPETEQIEIPEPPAKPSVPIASEDDFSDEDYDIFDTDFDDWDDWEAPPPEGDDDSEFVAYDKAPTPIITIEENIEYPDIAKSMGVEGKIYIKFFVDKKGKVDPNKITIIKGIPALNDAAISAVKKSRWKPAMQRDMKVGVYITVPINFELK